MSAFSSTDDVARRLRAVGYLPDAATCTVAYLADHLGKPVLVEGPAGVGKTELAKVLARVLDAELVRLQCYEGLDEAKALYEWNYGKQLLRVQWQGVAARGDDPARTWDEAHDDIFSKEFLLARPLLRAISSTEPTVLLVDEVDKVDFEFEALLLEVLSDFQVTVPELGTIAATARPYVVLTSNATRELSEALKRRCLYLHLDYPDAEREREIVRRHVPEVEAALADTLVRIVASLRRLELTKPPSIAETLDWARALVALGHESLDADTAVATLSVALKHHGDIGKAAAHLRAS